jgi:hypothetical protein
MTRNVVVTRDPVMPVFNFSSVLYFNVLTQQLQEPITAPAQDDKKNKEQKTIKTSENKTKLNTYNRSNLFLISINNNNNNNTSNNNNNNNSMTT